MSWRNYWRNSIKNNDKSLRKLSDEIPWTISKEILWSIYEWISKRLLRKIFEDPCRYFFNEYLIRYLGNYHWHNPWRNGYRTSKTSKLSCKIFCRYLKKWRMKKLLQESLEASSEGFQKKSMQKLQREHFEIFFGEICWRIPLAILWRQMNPKVNNYESSHRTLKGFQWKRKRHKNKKGDAFLTKVQQ